MRYRETDAALHSRESAGQMCKMKNRTLDSLLFFCYIPLEKNRKVMANLTEDEKIRKVIESNEGFFQSTISDVAQTKKGVWIFFEYDAEHEYYNSFFRFGTARELERIIAEVLADEMNILIETTAENIQLGLREFEINEAAQSSYGASIPELLKNMEVLNMEFQKSAERADVILRSMPGIFSRLKGEGQGGDLPASG